MRTASPQALDRIAQLLEHEHTNAQIATTLNAEGLTTGSGKPFTGASVHWLCYSHGLKNLRQRLRDGQWRTAAEIRAELGIGRDALRTLRTSGRLRARLCNDKGEWLYRPACEQPSVANTKPASRRCSGQIVTSL